MPNLDNWDKMRLRTSLMYDPLALLDGPGFIIFGRHVPQKAWRQAMREYFEMPYTVIGQLEADWGRNLSAVKRTIKTGTQWLQWTDKRRADAIHSAWVRIMFSENAKFISYGRRHTDTMIHFYGKDHLYERLMHWRCDTHLEALERLLTDEPNTD